MRLVSNIEKVSRIDVLNNLILLGTTSKELHGVMASGGDEIKLLQEGKLISKKNIEFAKFHSFFEGVVYSENEGEPVFYTDFENTIQVTDQDYYIHPLQNRNLSKYAVLIEMDKNFNQTYFLLTEGFDKISLPQFPKILLKDNFLFYNKSLVENYSLSTLELQWKLEIDSSNQVERRNQGNAVFSDGVYVFVRLKGGKLVCVSLETGLKIWELENEIEQVSFGEVGEFLYIHFGHGFNEVDKETGKITRSFLYDGVSGLESFSSNGIIWCFENLLITRNSFTGDLAVFKRSDFNLIGRVVVDEAGIPESKDCIRYQDGYLYVLSSSSTAYIFQIEL